jgi:hypothetical protein
VLVAGALATTPASAGECAANAALSACFDANSLWLPAGRASFVSFPDTRVNGVGQASFGIASEWLHRPVVLHVESPDRDGRDVHVVDTALDASFFLAFGVWKRLELSLAAPTRLYQSGAGAGGVSSQSAGPLDRNAVRNPRLGVGYSLDDALATPGLGVRLAVDVQLPLANDSPFAGERSLVAMPSLAIAFQSGPLRLGASLGVRLRDSLDVAGVRLGSQGFAALGVGLELLDAGRLFIGLEAFGLPSLVSSRAATANSAVSSETLFPAEWLISVHSSFAKQGSWTLGLAAGSGIPLSSETRETSAGASTAHFMGLTTPDFRSLLVLRFAPLPAPPNTAR